MGTLPINEKCPITTKKYLRVLLVVSGTIFTALGIIGIFIPVLPTTPFILLAVACYARSSRKLHNWLLTNKWFGKYISNYLQKKGIPLRIKAFTITLLWLTIGATALFAVEILIVRVILLVIAAGVTVHLLCVPTLK